MLASSRWVVCLAVVLLGLSGCGGSSSNTPAAAASAADPTVPNQQPAALSISGTPGSSAVVGTSYSFTPSVSASTGSKLTYSIQNKPAWTSFDATTGALSGTPDAASVGTYANIVISASNGTTNASLSAFSITVTDVASGTATVSWSIPTTNSDGTPLTNLAGFRIYYGTSASSMTMVSQVANAGLTSFVVTNLAPATWYFGVKAYTSNGVESTISNIASKTIS